MLSLEFVRGFDMSNALKKRKINKKLKLSLHDQTSYDITSYQLTRDRLNSDLEDSVSLKEIQRYAMENLGMIYENEGNVVYLNIDR